MFTQDWCYSGNWEYKYAGTQRYYFTEWLYGGGYGVPHTVYEKTIVITQSGELIESNWNVITGSALQSANAAWESALNLYWARVQWFEVNTAYNVAVGKTSTQAWVDPTIQTWSSPYIGEVWVGDAMWSLYHNDVFNLTYPQAITIDPLEDGWNFIVNEARITGWAPLP